MAWKTSDLAAAYKRQGLDPLRAISDGKPGQTPAIRSKYGARKKEVDGHLFDSTKEANHYIALRTLLSAGIIKNLDLQPRFVVQTSFIYRGVKYRKIEYVADFRFQSAQWMPDFPFDVDTVIVQDVKSEATRTLPYYRLKVKLFRALYPDVIFEEVI